MASIQSKGTCRLCNASFDKTGMTRHLQKCLLAQAVPAEKKARPIKLFHLLIDQKYESAYWLHVECRADAQLGHLDEFLRDLWLECCGHMSAFSIRAREPGEQGLSRLTFRFPSKWTWGRTKPT